MSRVKASAMYRFMGEVGCDDYDALYRWSIENTADFWGALCQFYDVRLDAPAEQIVARPDNIMDAGWFQGSRLNFAKHLLGHRGDRAALVCYREDGNRRSLTWDQPHHALDPFLRPRGTATSLRKNERLLS